MKSQAGTKAVSVPAHKTGKENKDNPWKIVSSHLFQHFWTTFYFDITSIIQLCLTLCDPQTVAHQGPLSMVFSKQEYWSGLSFPSPGDLPDPGIKPGSPALQADSVLSELPGKPSILSCKQEQFKKNPYTSVSANQFVSFAFIILYICVHKCTHAYSEQNENKLKTSCHRVEVFPNVGDVKFDLQVK